MEKLLSYEDAITQLSQITAKLESGQVTLDEALKLLERGKELVILCNNMLSQAKGKMTEIKEELNKIEEV